MAPEQVASAAAGSAVAAEQVASAAAVPDVPPEQVGSAAAVAAVPPEQVASAAAGAAVAPEQVTPSAAVAAAPPEQVAPAAAGSAVAPKQVAPAAAGAAVAADMANVQVVATITSTETGSAATVPEQVAPAAATATAPKQVAASASAAAASKLPVEGNCGNTDVGFDITPGAGTKRGREEDGGSPSAPMKRSARAMLAEHVPSARVATAEVATAEGASAEGATAEEKLEFFALSMMLTFHHNPNAKPFGLPAASWQECDKTILGAAEWLNSFVEGKRGEEYHMIIAMCQCGLHWPACHALERHMMALTKSITGGEGGMADVHAMLNEMAVAEGLGEREGEPDASSEGEGETDASSEGEDEPDASSEGEGETDASSEEEGETDASSRGGGRVRGRGRERHVAMIRGARRS
jgi:hypothetical protein